MIFEELMQIGVENLKNKKFKDAQKIFEKILIEQPMNAEINHLMGISFQIKQHPKVQNLSDF